MKTAPRQRPANVKAAVIGERAFKNLRLEAEAVAEFPYQPVACTQAYRLVVLRKNISVERGDQRLFDEIRYFFYLTNDRETRRPTSSSSPTIGATKRTSSSNCSASAQRRCRSTRC